jgi:hypothetical protein
MAGRHLAEAQPQQEALPSSVVQNGTPRQDRSRNCQRYHPFSRPLDHLRPTEPLVLGLESGRPCGGHFEGAGRNPSRQLLSADEKDFASGPAKIEAHRTAQKRRRISRGASEEIVSPDPGAVAANRLSIHIPYSLWKVFCMD